MNARSTIVMPPDLTDSGQYHLLTPFSGTENPRQLRVIHALLRGPCTRTEIDVAAGASNGPEVISQLRRLGLTILCVRIQKVDRDGLSVWPGVYRLTKEDRKKLLAWFKKRACKQSATER